MTIFHIPAALGRPRSRDMVSALWAVGGNIRYREYPDLMHWCWDQTYSDDAVLKWLFSQQKK